MPKGIFKIEFTGNKTIGNSDELIVSLDGNPNELAAGLFAAMNSKDDIAAIAIAAVVEYAKQKGITVGQLEYVVTVKPKGV